MKIACLCPTYGRKPELLEESLGCFLSQTHENSVLIIYDDLGNLANCQVDSDRVQIISTTTRSRSLPDKFAEMSSGVSCNAFAFWDDDDIYLPWHLEVHAGALVNGHWSKPSKIWSTYTKKMMIEDASGRFHPSMAIRRDAWDAMGGYLGPIAPGREKEGQCDQIMISYLIRRFGPAQDTLCNNFPSFVYGWGRSRHASGIMKGPHDQTWWDANKPQHTEPIEKLTPKFVTPAEWFDRYYSYTPEIAKALKSFPVPQLFQSLALERESPLESDSPVLDSAYPA